MQSAHNRLTLAEEGAGLPGLSFCGCPFNRIHQSFSDFGLFFLPWRSWNICLKFCVDTVWIPICLHVKGLLWMTIISCGFLPAKLVIWHKIGFSSLVNRLQNKVKITKIQELTLILHAIWLHKWLPRGRIILVTCVTSNMYFFQITSSDSSDRLSSDRACQILWQVSQNNRQTPWFSSRRKSPFLNRRQFLKFFNYYSRLL